MIGGATETLRNLIGGNISNGIRLVGGATANTIVGNYVGVSADGSADLGNGAAGISLTDSNDNTIGSDTAGEGNVISGNGGHGILLVNSHDVDIIANYIGTDALGSVAIGNDSAGIRVEGSLRARIGGYTLAGGNLISGNKRSGVTLLDGANDAEVINNDIGLGVQGETLGNTYNGVHLDFNTSGNRVSSNFIKNNGRDGIRVNGNSSGNALRFNTVADNGWLGIDLGEDGVSVNDSAPDSDGGANGMQNYAVVTSATVDVGLELRLESAAFSSYEIELYRSDSCDNSGYGQGEMHLGTFPVSTGASGIVTTTISTDRFDAGHFLTTTTTDVTGVQSTSEFSPCFAVSVPTAVSVQEVGASAETHRIISLPFLALMMLTSIKLYLRRIRPT